MMSHTVYRGKSLKIASQKVMNAKLLYWIYYDENIYC